MTDKITDEITASEVMSLDESGYGSGRHALVIYSAKSKGVLQRFVTARKYKRIHDGDRPGQMYAQGIQCLRYMEGDSCWQAICVVSSYWDV